jgi:predicted small lipoprotein YifL
MTRAIRVFAICVAVVLCLGSLTACGKKSALTPPPDSQYPKQYPRQ